LQPHREQQDQKDRKPEIRQRDAHLRQRHHADIAEPVVVGCGVDACRQRQRHRDQHRHDRKRNGQHQPLGDQARDRRAVDIAGAEVADEQALDPLQIANRQRLVEPELDSERAHRVRRGVRAHQHLRGVAGQGVEHQENDQGCADQRRQ
jgi:hypothetical protein